MNSLRDEFTRQLLTDSGITEGMRILDVGCGTGDVSILAAGLTGDTGEVIGIDISEGALEIAGKAASQNHTAVKFIRADIDALPHNIGIFDAIIGRRVLMYQKDAGQSINNLIPFLKENGKMIFQESDSMASSMCTAFLPLHSKIGKWIWETVAKEGGNIHIGMQLYSVMKTAGLNVTLIRSQAVLNTYESGSDLGWVARTMAPRMIQHGVVTADEMDIDTLEERLESERKESKTPFIRDMVFGICAEKR